MREKLEILLQENPNTITSEVAQSALESEDPKLFFQDLLQYGCQSGMISSLIRYSDTHAFYDKYYSEIEELRAEYEDSIGEPLKINNDLKNFLAWFAFEQVAYQLSNS